jgi:hypothetical protein
MEHEFTGNICGSSSIADYCRWRDAVPANIPDLSLLARGNLSFEEEKPLGRLLELQA